MGGLGQIGTIERLYEFIGQVGGALLIARPPALLGLADRRTQIGEFHRLPLRGLLVVSKANHRGIPDVRALTLQVGLGALQQRRVEDAEAGITRNAPIVTMLRPPCIWLECAYFKALASPAPWQVRQRSTRPLAQGWV